MLLPFVRDHIPLEQGLRLKLLKNKIRYACVRDHIPLEQGLRRSEERSNIRILCSQRPYSIRTRIKTLTKRTSSHSLWVRDHIPLEQGLRHDMQIWEQFYGNVRDHIPLEQGLRRRMVDL